MDSENMTDSERIIKLEIQMLQQEKDICAIFEDIREIKDRLLGRPSWSISILITGLTTLCVSLVILLLK